MATANQLVGFGLRFDSGSEFIQWNAAQTHVYVAMYLPQPIQDMPSFPTLCLSGRNKKLKASDVESPHRNGCWSGSPNKSTFHVMSRSSGQCQEIVIAQKSSSIARGCRRGWPTAFLSDWATLVRTSMSILPALAVVGVRWPMQTNWLDWAFICIWWQIYQMERCSNPSLRCISQSHFCLGRQRFNASDVQSLRTKGGYCWTGKSANKSTSQHGNSSHVGCSWRWCHA